jgi:pyruvate/2-oxoglutarate dehydrogenase complex dihydrolipoamide dehydrogenase (E3) component
MPTHFDAAIIGAAGQAGPSLANRLSQAGMTVAIIERRDFGATCVNTACTPTKTMVASAYAARVASRAEEPSNNGRARRRDLYEAASDI